MCELVLVLGCGVRVSVMVRVIVLSYSDGLMLG